MNAWKSMTKIEKKAYLDNVHEQKMRFMPQNLNRLEGMVTSKYDPSRHLKTPEPPITEGLRAGMMSYASINAAGRFLNIHPTDSSVDMTRSNKWTMWTTDAATVDGQSVEFLKNYDSDATTFLWSGRTAKNGAWEYNSEICPRFSAKQDSFYEKCGNTDPTTGVVVLGGWGACEEVLIGARRLLAGKSSKDITVSCLDSCQTCTLITCDALDNCTTRTIDGESFDFNSENITFASKIIQDYCGSSLASVSPIGTTASPSTRTFSQSTKSNSVLSTAVTMLFALSAVTLAI